MRAAPLGHTASMTWPFLYFADDALSHAELTAARLDGDVVELGEGFIPADAVETRELRAASLRCLIPSAVALTRASAAWVHGAIPTPPARHTVQRMAHARIHLPGPRLAYRDRPLPHSDVVTISALSVTTAVRTLADVARDVCRGDVGARPLLQALMAWRPALAVDSARWLDRAGPLPFKRPAAALLRSPGDYEVVTR